MAPLGHIFLRGTIQHVCLNPTPSQPRPCNPSLYGHRSRDMVLKDFTNVSTPLRAMLRAQRAQRALSRA